MRRTAAFAGSLVVAAAGDVRADASSVNANVSGNVSATDNAFAAGSGSQADAYTQLRPGLLFGYETPRAVYTATTQAEFLDYIVHYDQLAINVRASGTASFVATKYTDVTFNVSGSTGKLNALSGRSTPDQTTTTLLPSGNGTIYQASGGQALSYVAGPSVKLGESLGGSFVQTGTGGGGITRSAQANVGTGIYKSFEGNTIGFDVGVGYVRFLQYTPGVEATGMPPVGRLDRQVTPHAGVSWRHDLTRKWSTNLGVGIAGLVPFGKDPYDPMRDTSHRYVSPAVSAALSYVDTWGFANLTAAYGMTPNLLIAQNTISDSATGNVAIPLTVIERRGQAPRYTFTGSAGYTHQRLIDTASSATVGSFSGEHVDLGIGYIPRPSQVYSIRYTFAHQSGDPSALIPIPSLTTNTISFNFSLTYPERMLVVPPKHESVRSDESDIKGIDDKPADPDEPNDPSTSKRGE